MKTSRVSVVAIFVALLTTIAMPCLVAAAVPT